MQSSEGCKQLSVVLCQTHPELKQKTANIARFQQHLNKLGPQHQIDILLFPQMAFTGYNFKNQQEALPMSVPFGQGEEFQFAKSLAMRLEAYVLFGYVERVQEGGKVLLYNSAAMADRRGQFLFNTRKSHLYFADQLWAHEGDGFKSVVISNGKGQSIKCTVGICMDINPKGFTSGKFELGDYVRQQGSEVILFPTNWIDSQRHNADSAWDIYNYWLGRLRPLVKATDKKNVCVLVANRVGSEYSHHDKEQIWFMGGSCLLSIHPHAVLACIDKTTEQLIHKTIRLPAT